MHFQLSHHLHILRILKNTELKEMFIALSIKAFAIGLMGIFIPLYLLKELAYTLDQVLMFYMVFSLTYILIAPYVAQIANTIGLKHSILLSVPLYITFYLLLYNLKSSPELFYLTPVMYGLAACTFWIAYHIDFTKFYDNKYVPEEVGTMLGSLMIISLLGPLVGGILIGFMGFQGVFMIVTALLIVSTIPLFRTPDVHEPVDFAFKHIVRKQYFSDFLHFFSMGSRGVGFLFWGVYLFTFLQLYTSLGFVMTLAGFLSALSAYFFSHFFKFFTKPVVFDAVITLYALTWFARSFFSGLLGLVSMTLSSQFLFPMVDIPLISTTYKKARKGKKIAEYTVFREISINTDRRMILLQ